jgi:DNA-binding response OmpR family regulator
MTESRNVKLLAAYLRGDGFEPISALNETEALQLAVKEKPDVILLDVMMPDLDGFKVILHLKANRVT